MTLPLACPPPSSCAATDPPTGPQRKRRRRAPASGASDDCFACTKRNTKCDRRRPYCSQCLEVGKECSGYKTQLTWGVGVASRGKLRGLSLPVAKSAPAVRSPPVSIMRPRASSIVSPKHENHNHHQNQNHHRRETIDDVNNIKVKIKMENTASPVPANPFTTYDFVNMAPNGAAPPMQQQMQEWNMSHPTDYPLQDYHPQDGMSHQKQLPHLHRLHTHTLSLGRADSLHISSSLESLSAYTDSDYNPSPISQSFQGDEPPFLRSPMPIYTSFSSRNSTADPSPVVGLIGDARGPTSCPDHFYAQSEMSSSLSSHQNLYDIAEGRQQHASGNHPDVFYDDEMLGGSHLSNDLEVYATSARSSHFGWNSINDDDVASQATSEADAYHFASSESMSSSSTDMSPRISFFLDYYEKIICPSVVVIDTPSNPYREHILSLASSSRSLQHAICALSACNLRMKRRQSLGQDNWRRPLDLEFQDRFSSPPSRPSPPRRTSINPMSPPDLKSPDASLQEEYRHRSLAVSLLNQQLGDPSTASHDCVLATLFILCHYRMCESGIAQFRTQFAGVKKILGMRESGVETGNWGWMETLFTYFDGIAATINDREAQLRGGYLEMIASSSNPHHALENMGGCDAVLFKTIARLGRLNMLAQHRPVLDESSPTMHTRRPSLPNPRPRLAGQALVDFYNLHAHNFDGNGFASTLDDYAGSSLLTSSAPHDDLRTTFWVEWKAARQSLQEWEFDPSRLVSTLPATPTPTQLRDFGYVSEAFRYAALLYTERLACPNLPSSHLNFQNLVSQVLFYVTSLEQGSGAEKFLLWPLFISGSECVNELQQGIVRKKCREIMGRSGYVNNLAGLEVLEKLWQDNSEEHLGMRDRKDIFSGPFKWTRFMERGEGEWIMV